MRKYIAEFIGTFFLVLTIGCTVLAKAPGVIPPLAIGATLIAMVYACGHTSSAHFNPAVSLAFWIRGRMETKDFLPYVIAQILAAIAAALVATFLTDKSGTPGEITNYPQVIVAEFLFTFALAFVVLNVATAKGTSGNSFYGLAIGIIVMGGAFAVGPISGGVFNPAVAVAVVFMKLFTFAQIGVHIVADFAGGLVAGLAFNFINPNDK